MSTPQYVPPEFQDTIDLPSTTPNPGSVSAAQSKLSQSTAKATAAKKAVDSLTARLKAKGLTAAAKASLQAQLKAAQATYTVATNAQTAAQNSVYEVSGQYDKLLSGPNRDAFLALKSMFDQFGLGSLAGRIYDYTKQGYGADTISLLLQDTPEYKERFAANETRRKNGLPVLSPAEYLSVESAYRQLLQDSGMPKGFYDNPADFRQWIAGDVSPTEVKGRVDLAVASTSQANPYVKQQLAALYGVDESYLTAYFFDRTKSVPLLQKQEKTAEFAAEAARRGLLTDRERFEGYITQGLSQSAASQGFQVIADELPNLDAIAARFGTTFGQVAAEQAVFGTNAQSAEKRRGLASQERALFSGRQGASAGGLSAGYRQT
jgi:hypothetical protein